MEKIVFYDFEVFKADWIVTFISEDGSWDQTVHNDAPLLKTIFETHTDWIYVGYNNTRYDDFIFKGILLGYDAKFVNDWIISGDSPWKITSGWKNIPMITFDTMIRGRTSTGLKALEAYMGLSVDETEVPFDIGRPLTEDEVGKTIRYNRSDVLATKDVFHQVRADYDACRQLIEMYGLSPTELSRTKTQLAAEILSARKTERYDEWDLSLPACVDIKRYKAVPTWLMAPDNRISIIDDGKGGHKTTRPKPLSIPIMGVLHSVGWGGIHGARPRYVDVSGDNVYVDMDVASLYPSIMVNDGLLSRSADIAKYREIVDERIRLKKAGDPLQKPLKIVINSTYGGSGDPYSALYDPRQAHMVCLAGQTMIVDLLERLDGLCTLIQTNTDGIIVKLTDTSPEGKRKVWDVANEWMDRTHLRLEFTTFRKIVQKDVNNYIAVGEDGNVVRKGAYVKELTCLDWELAVVNRAVVGYFTKGVSPETTVGACDRMLDFQMVRRITEASDGFVRDGVNLPCKVVRLFASLNEADGEVRKIDKSTGKHCKLEGSPKRCIIDNREMRDRPVPAWLDKTWYVDLAWKRIKDFLGGSDG